LSTTCKINPKGHRMTKREQPWSHLRGSNQQPPGYWPQDKWPK
jgi:hypothetical protein